MRLTSSRSRRRSRRRRDTAESIGVARFTRACASCFATLAAKCCAAGAYRIDLARRCRDATRRSSAARHQPGSLDEMGSAVRFKLRSAALRPEIDERQTAHIASCGASGSVVADSELPLAVGSPALHASAQDDARAIAPHRHPRDAGKRDARVWNGTHFDATCVAIGRQSRRIRRCRR